MEFAADGGLTFATENGRWHVDEGVVHLTTPQWSCEGPIGVEELYLVCSREANLDRLELEMVFSPH